MVTDTAHIPKAWQESDIGRIPCDWAVTTMGSIAKILTDGSHFSPKPTAKGRYMASVKDMSYSGFDFSQCKHITEKDYLKLKKAGCSPEQGDVLISKDGANCLDIIFVYSQPEEIVLLSSIAILRLRADHSPSFYTYFLLSPVSQRIMRNWFVSGSAIPRVVLKDFRDVPVPRLPFPEQKAIANVLSSLDDKIELLRKQNETLEAIAQTIFNEWFVNFNFPDKNGQPYKASGGKMVDSELGEIPEGWRVGSLSQVAEFLNGLALQKYPPKSKDGYLPVIKIKELKNGISTQTDKASNDIESKYIIENGDLLFSWSGSLEVVFWKHSRGALNQHLFKVTSEDYPKWFYYFWIKYHLPSFRQIASNKATTMGHIQRYHLDDSKVLIPGNVIMKNANSIIAPCIDKIIINNQQINILTTIRDTLLPKLMSGQVRVG